MGGVYPVDDLSVKTREMHLAVQFEVRPDHPDPIQDQTVGNGADFLYIRPYCRCHNDWLAARIKVSLSIVEHGWKIASACQLTASMKGRVRKCGINGLRKHSCP